jgi:isoamylase
VREYWKGDAPVTELTPRICASGDMFNHQGRRPWASVNFITAHDGFTLNDVVTYNDKHNDANGEENRDGTNDNRSWNCGVEGPSDDPEIEALRARQARNMMATLLLAQGTPMMLAGDEFGRTQDGNNNAYCQDNPISWLNWEIEEKGTELTGFVRKLTKLRRDYPILRRGRFLTGTYNEELGVKDVMWINANGTEMTTAEWSDTSMRCFGMMMDGRAQPTGIRRRGDDATVLLIMNSHHDMVLFSLPKTSGGASWTRFIDTNLSNDADQDVFMAGATYEVTGRSLLVFVLQPKTEL